MNLHTVKLRTAHYNSYHLLGDWISDPTWIPVGNTRANTCTNSPAVKSGEAFIRYRHPAFFAGRVIHSNLANRSSER